MQETYDPNKDIVFSWNATSNTTHYNAYFDKMGSDGTYTRIENAFYVESGFTRKLDIGKYRIVLQATNSNYFEADHSNWLFTEGNWVEFEVSHSYKSTVTAPTCTSQGYTTHTCSVCDDSYKDAYTVALGHSYTYKVATAPTTSADGKLTGTCSRCNSTTAITLPKLSTTDYTYSVVKAASCTATGTGRYIWKTTTYGTLQFDVTLPKTDHSYKSTVTAPTCTERGYTSHTCSVCDDSYKDAYTVALGHSYTYKVATAPTTSADGKLTGTCSRCNGTTTITLPKLNMTDYTYSVVKAASCTAIGTGRYVWNTTTYGKFQFDVTLPKTNHSYKSTVTAPTCTLQGYTTHTCSVCGDSYKDAYTDALGHSYAYKVAAAPTTSANGKLVGTCSRCNGTTTITLPKLNMTDYTYSVVKAASCTAIGTGRYVWNTTTYGKFQFDVTLPKTNHSYKSTVTAPTCTLQGYTTHTCSVCGDSYKDTYTDALGHSYAYKVATAPTTSADGKLTGTCSRCNSTTAITLPKLSTTDYTYSVVKAASCTATGTGRYIWKTTTYGTLQFDVTLPKTDHSYKSTVTAPTCTERGYTTHICSVCGDSYKDSYTAALGHDYYAAAGNDATCTTAAWTEYNCSRCGDHYRVEGTPALGHAWNDGEITTPATEEQPGVKTYTCTRCSATKTEAIPPLTHTHVYSDTIVAPTCMAGGYTTHTCRCGYSYKDAYTAALGHDYYAAAGNDATCTTAAWTEYNCSRCGDHYRVEGAPALGHNYIPARGVEATCTSPEMWEWQCTRCKDSYVVEGAPALGHDFRWVVDQEATTDAPGYQHEECTRCHATRSENTLIPTLDHVCDGGETCPGRGFADMPAAGNWAHAGIDYCVSHGLMNGVGKGQFDPNGTLTRAMLVTVLYRVQGEPDISGLGNPFEDVPDGMWYTEPIIWAASKQVVNGTSATTFEPDTPITREQIAAILYRYAKEVEGKDVSASAALDGFADAASVSGYARTPLGWASALGYIKGSNENGTLLLNPQGNATRAEVATILMRYLEQ